MRSDAELLERYAAAADDQAFAEIVRRHGAMVYRTCLRLLGDAHQAEDAAQAAFLVLCRRAGSVRGAELAVWLHGVARNAAHWHGKARARRLRHEEEAGMIRLRESAPDVPAAERAAALEVLDRELGALPAAQRQAVLLRYLEGRGQEEAARIAGCPQSTLATRATEGLARLRGRLARRDCVLSPAGLAGLLQAEAGAAVAGELLGSIISVSGAGASGAAAGAGCVPIAEGVLKMMFWAKVRISAAVVGALCLAGSAVPLAGRMLSAGESPGAGTPAVAEPAPGGNPQPGQVAAGRPDKHGIVTTLRPCVTRLAPGDPLTIAVHWALGDEPMPGRASPACKPPFNAQHDRAATLDSLVLRVTAPGGTRREFRASVAAPPEGKRNLLWLYHTPTFLLTLDKQGFSEGGGLRGTWKEKDGPDFAAPGTYRLALSGRLALEQHEALPFESGEIAVELGTGGYKTIAELYDLAGKTLKEKVPDRQAGKEFDLRGPATLEDDAGNRAVRFNGGPIDESMPWSYDQYTVLVSPEGKVLEVLKRTIGTCLAAGTPVETENGPVPVERVRPGDRVWGYDPEARRRMLTAVELVSAARAAETVVLGGTLRVTANHPVYTRRGWLPAGDVRPDDQMMNSRGELLAAGPIRRAGGPVAVFDLTVGPPHNFFAGGFLVHNKDRDYWPRVDDPWYLSWPVRGEKSETVFKAGAR